MKKTSETVQITLQVEGFWSFGVQSSRTVPKMNCSEQQFCSILADPALSNGKDKKCIWSISEQERKLFGKFSKIGQQFYVKARDRALAGSHVSTRQDVGRGSDVRRWLEGPGGS